MHVNIISFHTSAKHNRNVVIGPSPGYVNVLYTVIKRDGLDLIGEEESIQTVLASSPYFKDFNPG